LAQSVLFCIPYAGGIAEVTYGKWQACFGNDLDVVPLEPAGHGRRMNEAFEVSIQSTAENFLPKIKEAVAQGKRYAIYAHSMGTLIAYELVKAIAAANLPEPKGLFLSGRLSPEHQYTGPDLHELSDTDLIESLKNIDGSPKDLFNIPELMKAFLPIIRSDYRITETYQFEKPRYQIRGFIHCFFSGGDSLVNLEDMHEWKKYCQGEFLIHRYSGHHFFIHDQYVAICEQIKNVLLDIVATV